MKSASAVIGAAPHDSIETQVEERRKTPDLFRFRSQIPEHAAQDPYARVKGHGEKLTVNHCRYGYKDAGYQARDISAENPR